MFFFIYLRNLDKETLKKRLATYYLVDESLLFFWFRLILVSECYSLFYWDFIGKKNFLSFFIIAFLKTIVKNTTNAEDDQVWVDFIQVLKNASEWIEDKISPGFLLT